MPYVDADLVAIRAAIAKGTLSVQFGDRREQYRSIAELKDAEAHILSQLTTTTPTRPKQFVGVASKGL